MRECEDREKWELTAALAELRQVADEHRRRKAAARQPSVLRQMLASARALIAGLDRELRAGALSRPWRLPHGLHRSVQIRKEP